MHNVGTSTSLNFRIQNHNLLLVETEGHYTSQQNYTSFDIHVGQSYSFLVTMDQNASSDYYIVASARFVNETFWQRVTGVAILHYSNSKGAASGPLPEAPSDIYNQWAAMTQPRSIRYVLEHGKFLRHKFFSLGTVFKYYVRDILSDIMVYLLLVKLPLPNLSSILTIKDTDLALF